MNLNINENTEFALFGWFRIIDLTDESKKTNIILLDVEGNLSFALIEVQEDLGFETI